MRRQHHYTSRMKSALLMAWGLVWAAGCIAEGPMPKAEKRLITTPREAPQDNKVPLDELRRFATAVEYIKAYYVKDVTNQMLFDNAIQGMLGGLDPHSAYFTPEEFKELRSSTSGQFGGIGVEVLVEDGFIRVISPLDDTPAQKAGLKAGDLIWRLDDTPIKGLSQSEAITKMRGEKGTALTLTVTREGEPAPLEIKVIRDIITVQSVKHRWLEPAYAYVRIAQFQQDTAQHLKKALQKLKSNPLKGLVLDLRNNPGGLLESSVEVADLFLDLPRLRHEGLIVYTQSRDEKKTDPQKATPGDLLEGVPLVVLINEGSASASEIVAGALQDHQRALIVGSDSFGKGSVQTVYPMKDKYGMKLTTAFYYTPRGRSIQGEGIHPDISVLPLYFSDKDKKRNKQILEQKSWVLKEKDLQGHLKHAEESEPLPKGKLRPTETSPAPKDKAKSVLDLLEEDYPLSEALNLVKGLSMMQAAS